MGISPRKPSGRRPRGGDYDILHDGDYEMVPVDLSSLAGMGYTVTDFPQAPGQSLDEQETAYGATGPSGEQASLGHVRKHSRIGDGMVIGAKLQRDGSSSTALRGRYSSQAAFDAAAIERSRTVRDIGQSLAQRRQVIVAVNNPVEDISFLEGGSVNHRSSAFDLRARSTTFDLIAPDGRPQGQAPQSYFFPTDPDVPNWRPFSMRAPYILMLIFVSLGLAIFQEWLCRHSEAKAQENKGLIGFNDVSEISVWDFFAWKYLPTMITIVYAVLFSIMDFDIRRLEPYYQLSRPQGSRASASLNLDHLTLFQFFVPFKAFRLKQWVVFFSTIGNITASIVSPSLQNPSINFMTNPHCVNGTCPAGQPKFFVRVSPAWSRVLTAVLTLTAAVTAVIFVQLRRKSGLLSDPKGIAGIAAMATKSHILQEFTGLDLATRGEIHQRLQHRRFILYKSSIWQGEWSYTQEPVQESERRLGSPHPISLQMRAGIPFLAFMVFMLAAVPAISLTPARVVPNAVPWLPILLATVLKLLFSTFESDVRMMEPFYRLSLGGAAPQDSLTLDYQGTVYGWMPFKAARKGHYLLALVGVSSVLLDVFSVTVSSFSVDSDIFLHHHHHDGGAHGGGDVSNQDETFVSFWTSVSLSIAILSVVITTTALVYARRRHPFLPREPSTIASVLAFVYASKMLDDFIDAERLTNRQMEARLRCIGKRYALGWFRGRDGRVHCAIDEEPLTSRYVHGKPYSKALAFGDPGGGDGPFV